MHELCMQYVGGIGHGGCPARYLQASRPPRTGQASCEDSGRTGQASCEDSEVDINMTGSVDINRSWHVGITGELIIGFISNMFVYPWSIYIYISLEYEWNMYGICKEYVSNKCGICMETCMEYVRNMYGV